MIAAWWARTPGTWGAPEGTRCWGWPVSCAEDLDVMPEEYEDLLAWGTSAEPAPPPRPPRFEIRETFAGGGLGYSREWVEV